MVAWGGLCPAVNCNRVNLLTEVMIAESKYNEKVSKF